MKTALVCPPTISGNSLDASLSGAEHLGLGYLTSALRKNNYEVKIINSELERLSEKDLIKAIEKFSPQVIGFSPVSESIKVSLRISEYCKEKYNIINIMGGHLATLSGDSILKNEKFIDFIIQGDGENAFVKLLDLLSSGKDCYEKVPNLIWRSKESKEIISNNIQTQDFSLIDNPSRDDLEKLIKCDGGYSARILASKGCPFNCSFCTTPIFYKRKVNFRSPESVINEMDIINRKYNIKHFRFNDDLFINRTSENTSWIKEFCNKLSGKQYTFRILCRVDSFDGNNKFLLELLCNVGLTHIFLGVESGSDYALKVYNKKTTYKMNINTISIIKQLKLNLQIGFIMFNPYTTFDEIVENLNFLIKINQSHRLYYLMKSISIFPNKPIERKIINDGLLKYSSYKEPIKCYKFKDSRIEKISYHLNVLYESISYIDKYIMNITDKFLIHGIQKINVKNFNKMIELSKRNFEDLSAISMKWENELMSVTNFNGDTK